LPLLHRETEAAPRDSVVYAALVISFDINNDSIDIEIETSVFNTPTNSP
jgi:hypothetical protein